MENEMETPVKEDNSGSTKSESCESVALETVAAAANSEEQDVGSPAPQEASSAEQPQAAILSEAEQVALLEALLLASGDPLSIARIQDVMGLTKGEVLARADKLQASFAGTEHGIELIVVAEKLQLRTKAAFAEHVRQLMAVKPRKLSQAALETLAVIAYQQPVVKSEIDKIRGVDVAPTLKTLLERKLVKIIGYQASVGQPALYGTTEDFLQVFGLASLSSLPALQDLKAMVKEPGEAGGAEDEEQSEAAVSEVDDEVAGQTPPESPENSGAQIVQ
jgi:segregation and condensation protein B